jgi:hypothetical protein
LVDAEMARTKQSRMSLAKIGKSAVPLTGTANNSSDAQAAFPLESAGIKTVQAECNLCLAIPARRGAVALPQGTRSGNTFGCRVANKYSRSPASFRNDRKNGTFAGKGGVQQERE